MMKTELSLRTIKMMVTSISEIFVVPVEQLSKVIFHGIILFFIIMGFWLLDSLKDPILANFVGMNYQPIAKLFSVLSTLVLVCVYDFLTSVISKANLFYLISISFGLVFMVLSALISDPKIGLNSLKIGPDRYVGWFFYFSIEAYGSLMVAMFWSYTNSVMNLEQAKGAYGLIIAIAQIGAILGATMATHADEIGIALLVLLGSIIIFSVGLLFRLYYILFRDHIDEVHTVESSVLADLTGASASVADDTYGSTLYRYYLATYRFFSGFYEGLVIICSYHYTLKLLALSCLYEIVVTVLDYEFKLRTSDSLADVLAVTTMSALATDDDAASHLAFPVASAAPLPRVSPLVMGGVGSHEEQFATLMGHFGQLTNFLSLIVSLFGFSLIVKRMGVRFSLLVFPVILFAAVVVSNLASSLRLLFVLVSLLKALIFSLNEPVKELLYIPTSHPIKYRAKAWIDVFGSRLAKAVGSFITSQSKGDIGQYFVNYICKYMEGSLLHSIYLLRLLFRFSFLFSLFSLCR